MSELMKALIKIGYQTYHSLETEHKEEILAISVFSRLGWGNMITIWECLTHNEKESYWNDLYERVDDPDVDFGHSGLCEPLEQAAAFMLTQWVLEAELEGSSCFDDLDFVSHFLPADRVDQETIDANRCY